MGIKEAVYEYVAGRGERGASDSEIAEALGRPQPSVRRYRRELQLESRVGVAPKEVWRGKRKAMVFIALDEIARPTKVGCPLCSEKGWIVRAPKPEPIPMPPPKVVEPAPGGYAVVEVPKLTERAEPEPELVQPTAPEPEPEPEPKPRIQYLMGVSQRY